MSEERVYTIMSLGTPLFTSRSSEIFRWEGEDKLLKLFRKEVDRELIDGEEINTREAFAKGVTEVECFGQVEVEGRHGIILKKVEGATLIGTLGKQPSILFKASQIMADLQIEMHNTHTDKIRSYKEMVKHTLMNAPVFDYLTSEEKDRAIAKINALPDGDSILHFDYHPDNIMTHDGKSTIIDWMTSCSGAPAADVAATVFLLTEGEMIPGLSKAVAAVMQFLRRKICRSYYKKYKAQTGMTDDEVQIFRLPFMIFRLGVWTIESEIQTLQQKIREEIAK